MNEVDVDHNRFHDLPEAFNGVGVCGQAALLDCRLDKVLHAARSPDRTEWVVSMILPSEIGFTRVLALEGKPDCHALAQRLFLRIQ